MVLLGMSNRGAGLSKWFACAGVGCVAVCGVGGFLVYKGMTGIGGFVTELGKQMGIEESFELKSPSRYDPFASLDEVRSHLAPGAKLVGIRASSVRSDGTMDLTARYTPGPSASYEFFEPTQDGIEKTPPVGAGRKPDDVWAYGVKVECYQPGKTSHVTKVSGGSTVSYMNTNKGMMVSKSAAAMHDPHEAVAEPKLTTQDMWATALKLGAPKDAVAVVEYDDRGYDFTIPGAKFSLHWGSDGVLDEKRSSVPR